jgi:hypothetical protein
VTGYESDYSAGRREGTAAYLAFGEHIADEMAIFLCTLDRTSAYALGFVRSVNEEVTNRVI